MPLVRISLLQGASKEHIRAIADGVHQALAAVFHTPAEDRFQVIRRLKPDEFIFDAGYLGVQRTDELVLIQIFASRTRDTAAKQALYRSIADNLSVNPGIRQEDILIVLSPNDRDDWSFGNGLASYVPGVLPVPGARG